MKKLVIGLLLLAVVVAVSYLKMTRQDARVTEAHEAGYSKGAGDLEATRSDADSLRNAVAVYQQALTDSLARRDSIRLSEQDSLARIITAQSDSLKAASAKPTAAANTSASQTGTQKSINKAKSREQILAYYRKQYEGLPGDLSPYERRVALTEIRERTARQFSISMSELDTIRKNNNLPY